MSQLSDLEYLKLSKGQKFGYKLGRFFTGIPKGFAQVTTGIELIKDLGADNPDNNIVFVEPGNYTVTWDGTSITIVKN